MSTPARYSARYRHAGTVMSSGFHYTHAAVDWLLAAQRQGELEPIGVVDNHTGALVVSRSELDHAVSG